MKTNTFLFLIVLLMVSLGANYIQMRAAKEQQDYRKDENSRFQVEQSRKLGEIKARDSVISSLLSARAKDSAQHQKTQVALKSKINALKRGSDVILDFQGGSIQFYDTITGLYFSREIFNDGTWKDTVIYLQDELIKDLENERDTLYLVDTTIIDSLKSSNNQLKGMFAEQWIRADRLKRDYDREKRKRFSVGPHAGWDLNGPSIGVSVQYSLFKF